MKEWILIYFFKLVPFEPQIICSLKILINYIALLTPNSLINSGKAIMVINNDYCICIMRKLFKQTYLLYIFLCNFSLLPSLIHSLFLHLSALFTPHSMSLSPPLFAWFMMLISVYFDTRCVFMHEYIDECINAYFDTKCIWYQDTCILNI